MLPLLVIGASNIDYLAYLDNEMILKDSNVGRVKISYGGVGRNIVENLARLGIDITFITAIGEEASAYGMKKELLDLQVKLVLPKTKLSSSSYIAFINKDHDMEVGLSDTRIVECINIAFLQKKATLIEKFQYICLDGNLDEEVIDYFFLTYHHKKIIVDAISTKKAQKFKKHLDKIYLFKANIYEAQAILEKKLPANELIKIFQKKNIPNMIITQGLENIVYLYDHEIYESPVVPQKNVVNATGAGDAFLAGVVYQILNGEKNHEKIINFGKEVANYTLLAEEAVNKKIGALALERKNYS